MRSVRIATVILIAVVFAVVLNAIVIRRSIDCILCEVESAENDEYAQVFEHFKKMESYISLSVDHEDMMNIELAFAELVAMVNKGDADGIEATKSRLKYSLEHLRRLSGLNIDSIF
jgi:hypothetical protein